MNKTHSGFVGLSGAQNHSAGDDCPVIVACIGGYPAPGNNAFYRVSNQGVSRDVSTRAERDRCVAMHKNAERITDAIFAARAKGSGCTVRVDGGDLPDSGYCVGVDFFESKWECSGLPYKTVYADVFEKLEALECVDDSVCIGSWIYRGELFCDVSLIFADRSEAIKRAKKWNQRAIFDIAEGTEVKV